MNRSFLLAVISLLLPLGCSHGSDCLPVEVGNLRGNHIVPGSLGMIPYAVRSGNRLYLDAYVQPGDEIRPGVVVMHGGSWTSGSRIAFVSQFLEMLTEAGFNWFSIDYRLSPEAPFPAPLEDLESAFAFIRCNAQTFQIDPDRLAILAEDSAVQAALLAPSRNRVRAAAVVALGGHYDLTSLAFFEDNASFARVFGQEAADPESRADALQAASPMFSVSSEHPPLLIVHGTRDSQTPLQQAEDYCEAVRQAGAACRLIPVQDGVHRPENWLPKQWAYKTEVTDWLTQRLELTDAPTFQSAYDSSRYLRKNLAYGSYRDSTGQEVPLRMDACRPDSKESLPAVILVHGGGWEAGDKATYLTPVLAPLAEAGFAWFSIDYRLTPDFGNTQQLDDVRRAIRFIRYHARELGIDPNRIGILGESAGGQLVTQIGALPCPGNPGSDDPVEQESCAPQAVVSFYGVYDFLAMARDASPGSLVHRLFGRTNLDDETRTLLREFSPYYRVHSDMPSLLLVNGTNESLWEQAQRLAERLEELGADFELVRLEDAPHGMENWEGHPEWEFYKPRLVNWLGEKLR